MKIFLIITSVLLGAAGQIFFKTAVRGSGSVGMLQAARISLFSPMFWGGLCCYGVSLVLWMKILSDTDLSYARPFAGAGYIVTAVLAWIVLGEQISVLRWAGILMICTGVVLVART